MRRVTVVVDQGLISASTLVCNLAIARTSSAEEYGAFAIAFSLYLVALGVTRSLSGDVIVVFGRSWESRAREVASAARVSSVAGLIFGIPMVVVAMAFRSDVSFFAASIGLALPLLLAYDCWRYGNIQAQRMARLLLADTVWLTAVSAGFSLSFWWAPAATPIVQFTLWLGVGGVLGLIAVVSMMTLGRGARGFEFWARNRSFTVPYLLDYILMFGASQIALLVVSTAAGLQYAGAVRGAQTLLGVVNVFVAALAVVTLRDISRDRVDISGRAILLRTSTAGGIGALLCFLLVGICVIMPVAFGRNFFGESWTDIAEFVVPLGVAAAFSSLGLGATTGLRALAQGRASLRTRAIVAPLIVGATLAGYLFGDIWMAMWAYCAACIAACGIWWIVLSRITNNWQGGNA